jgi:hypothetical protein
MTGSNPFGLSRIIFVGKEINGKSIGRGHNNEALRGDEEYARDSRDRVGFASRADLVLEAACPAPIFIRFPPPPASRCSA